MAGFISHYKLDKWWREVLSDAQREELERAFDSLMSSGKGPEYMTGDAIADFLEVSNGDGEEEVGLTRGDVAFSAPTRAAFVRLLADQTTSELADRLRNHAREIEEGNA